jgi:tetratricopeptide (TPR) repeat protein
MSSKRSRTVADLLLRHAEARSSGVMTLLRGQVKKQLYLHDGMLVSADSNLREEALGGVLIALGLMPAARLNELLGEVKKRGQKMGRVLADLGWVSPDDILMALAEQVRGRAVSCLRWTENETSFVETTGFVGGLIEHRFELGSLVFNGLRDTCTLDLLAATLDQESGQKVGLSERFQRYRLDFVGAFGADVAHVMDSGIEIAQLVLRPDAIVLAYGLDALIVTGMTELDDDPRAVAEAFTAESTARDPAPLGIESLAELARSPTAASLRKLPERGTGSRAGEPELPADLKMEYLEIHGRSAVDVLGVPANATQEQISRAYEDKRARIVELATLAPHRPMLEEMLEAYARARASLASAMASSDTVADAWAAPTEGSAMDPLGAELAFVDGRALLDTGQPAEAIPHLQQAVDSRPDQAAYHAWLAWAIWQARGQEAINDVRDRLGHALVLDPDSVEGHALQGAFLCAVGDTANGRTHLERTLALRPEQSEVIDRLVGIYLDHGEPEQAEKLYQKLIAALGDRYPVLRARLWHGLGRLYEGPLADPTAAAKARESAGAITAP